MEKDEIIFDERNKEKKRLHQLQSDLFIYEREIWYIKMGINIGFEQNGKKGFKRPVLVLKMIGNMFLVIRMTTQGKENKRYYYQLQSFGELKSRIIISQIKMIDKKRFLEKIGHISGEEYLILKKTLRDRYFPVPSS